MRHAESEITLPEFRVKGDSAKRGKFKSVCQREQLVCLWFKGHFLEPSTKKIPFKIDK